MARFQIYGHKGCPYCAALLAYLKEQGVPFEPHEISYDPPGAQVLQRAAHASPAYEWVDAEAAEAAGIDIGAYNCKDLVSWLTAEPQAIRAPLIVRGKRVVLGNDLSAAQSIMY
jgi:arsenate reductase-like glutaredoxin family protein